MIPQCPQDITGLLPAWSEGNDASIARLPRRQWNRKDDLPRMPDSGIEYFLALISATIVWTLVGPLTKAAGHAALARPAHAQT